MNYKSSKARLKARGQATRRERGGARKRGAHRLGQSQWQRQSQRVDSHNKRLNRISAAKAHGSTQPGTLYAPLPPAPVLSCSSPAPSCSSLLFPPPTAALALQQVRKLIVRRQSKTTTAPAAVALPPAAPPAPPPTPHPPPAPLSFCLSHCTRSCATTTARTRSWSRSRTIYTKEAASWARPGQLLCELSRPLYSSLPASTRNHNKNNKTKK